MEILKKVQDFLIDQIGYFGIDADKQEKIFHNLAYDKKNNLTAMMRTTAFPAAIILQMLVEGKIKDRGVLKQEESVPGYEFMGELEKRGIYFDSVDK